MSSTQPARGTRDFLPEDTRRREFVVAAVREVYERYGFEPLETPAFENIETLTGKYGEEGNRLIFKILKRGEQETAGVADLALRYDLTVPLARVVAELPPGKMLAVHGTGARDAFRDLLLRSGRAQSGAAAKRDKFFLQPVVGSELRRRSLFCKGWSAHIPCLGQWSQLTGIRNN